MGKFRDGLIRLGYAVLCVLAAAPLLLVIAGNIACILECRYPWIDWEGVPVWLLLSAVAALPTLIVGIVALVQHVRALPLRKVTVGVITGLCILLTPVWGGAMILSFMANPCCSWTEDAAHYRLFDAASYLDDSPYADALLPQAVEGTDAVYAYWFSGVGRHDVYAAWTLEPEALAAEQARVEALMAGWGVRPEMRGSFLCYEDTWTDWGERHTLLFACDPAAGEVRYAVCEIDEEDVPFHQRQEW